MPYYTTALETLDKLSVQQLVQQRVLKTKECIARCAATDSDEVVVFVSKMTPVRVAELSKQDLAILKAKRAAAAAAAAAATAAAASGASSAEGDTSCAPIPVATPNIDDGPEEVLMALARVFSGVLRRTSNLYILGHRHDPLNSLQTVPRDSLGGNDVVISLDGDVPEGMTTVTRVPPGAFGLYICLVSTIILSLSINAFGTSALFFVWLRVFKTNIVSLSLESYLSRRCYFCTIL
jgi:hypothetical protein